VRILIVEDDEFKQNAIHDELVKLGLDFDFTVEKSVQAAIDNINSKTYDLILLDMSLPSHNLIQGKGAPVPMPSGGMEVVMELSYLGRQERIIILTQYPEIEIDNVLYKLADAKKKISSEYDIHILAVIRFLREQTDWKKFLISNIKENF
jgi:CheY-like chemotaxis protein